MGDLERLLDGLAQQKELMLSNADLMKKVCPENGHYVELAGAAKITQTWIDGLQKDKG